MYLKLKQEVLPQLIPSHSRVLIAVSGGPDSVALAHILWRYVIEFQERNISLVITHVNHGVRSESVEEEVMVKDLAKKWDIPCIVHRFDAGKYARESGESFETASREWRYARWKEDMKKEGCDLLATAHHLGDQAETILYRLLRGSGTAGLAGIYPQRNGIIRPLLSISKKEILEYCQLEQLPFAIDSTNNEAIYVRNKIRLELLPDLENSYNPRVSEALGRTAELLRWDEEYLSDSTEKAWSKYFIIAVEERIALKREVFNEPYAILSRLLRKAVGAITGEPRGIGFRYIEEIMNSKGKVGWSQDLPGLNVHIEYDGIWFEQNKQKKILRSKEVSLSISASLNEWKNWTDRYGYTWKMGLFYQKDYCKVLHDLESPNNEYSSKKFFDRIEIEDNINKLRWRNRYPGDKMWFEKVGRKSLKKVFQEAQIGAELRKVVPLLTMNDEVLWVPGLSKGERFMPQAGNKITAIVIRKNDTR